MRTAILPFCGILGTVCGISILPRIGAKRLNFIGLEMIWNPFLLLQQNIAENWLDYKYEQSC